MKRLNRLGSEKSPYLLQHRFNPVDWYPWGDEAFARAKVEGKPIFLSIGYSTCYWCHVMEQECFENSTVADALNAAFICVKVDREEHPDVDEIYMDAVLAMNGQGGWPMSVFLTPDLKPFWGGTYIPRPNFLSLLAKIGEVWRDSPAQIKIGGEKLLQFLSEKAQGDNASSRSASTDLFGSLLTQAKTRFDPVNGGFGDAPKFPSSLAIRALLRAHKKHGAPEALAMAERSLEAMACGGIYDQLGGGFHRYSTDDEWLTPHFEKMLYDNALLVPAYLEAYQLTGKEFYAQVARETLHYLARDMRSNSGCFFAAEDAGDVGREGEFYVWSFAELRSALGEGAAGFSEKFKASEAGNFEHQTNILNLRNASDWLESRSGDMNRAREKLLALRSQRNRPHCDTKVLTGWNGLALSAFSLGARVLHEPEFLSLAENCANWMQSGLWNGIGLSRRAVDGDVRFSGTSSDYVFLIQGLIHLYEATFSERWLLWARELQLVLDENFWDEKKGGYFTAAHNEPHLIVRKKDTTDGALPSPNSVALGNLLRLEQYFLEPILGERARLLRDISVELTQRAPMAVSELISQLYYQQEGSGILVLTGSAKAANDFCAEFAKKFCPETLVGWAGERVGSKIPAFSGKHSGASQAYLCRAGTCEAPKDFSKVWEQLVGRV